MRGKAGFVLIVAHRNNAYCEEKMLKPNMSIEEIRTSLEQGAYIHRIVDPSGIDRSTLVKWMGGNVREDVILHTQWDELANAGFIVLHSKGKRGGIDIEKWFYWEEMYKG